MVVLLIKTFLSIASGRVKIIKILLSAHGVILHALKSPTEFLFKIAPTFC